MSDRELEWILPEVVEALHHEQLLEHGGIQGIRDPAMLDSALGRPQQLFAYGEPPPDICAMAATYAFGLAKDHPYLDGNKRTAAICCELFLNLNGLWFTVDEVAKYPKYLALASGDITEDAFADWLRQVTEQA